MAALQSKLQEQEQLRRALHNTIQELKGNIRVFCRVRPSGDEDARAIERFIQELGSFVARHIVDQRPELDSKSQRGKTYSLHFPPSAFPFTYIHFSSLNCERVYTNNSATNA